MWMLLPLSYMPTILIPWRAMEAVLEMEGHLGLLQWLRKVVPLSFRGYQTGKLNSCNARAVLHDDESFYSNASSAITENPEPMCPAVSAFFPPGMAATCLLGQHAQWKQP